MINSMIID